MICTAEQAIAFARARGVQRLDAQLLLAHHLGRPRSWVIAHADAALAAPVLAAFRADVERRAGGVPLAYLTGRAGFHGLSLRVTPAVLVPRPETETLVDWALEQLETDLRDVATPAVVDLGTGSAAIALAVKSRCPRADVVATDSSAEALAVARENARALQVELETVSGDWWDAVPGRRFHLALSNPPYVALGDPHLPALACEPATALTAGADGLDALRRIVAGAPAHLHAGGWLLVEHGHDQARAVAALLSRHRFSEIRSRADLCGTTRFAGGRRLASRASPRSADSA